MKMSKFVKGGLAVVMAASLAACGNSSTGSASASGSADGGKKYVLGGSGPLTGDAAVYGLAVEHGAQIAVGDEVAHHGAGEDGIDQCDDRHAERGEHIGGKERDMRLVIGKKSFEHRLAFLRKIG